MAKQPQNDDVELVEVWTLPPAATLGSSVRAKGILLEIRARMPLAQRKSLDISGMGLRLGMPENEEDEFCDACKLVVRTLKEIENIPVIPREIQDILTISATERYRWLADGRLPSAGTRTVKLRGRAKKITFHVFDPRLVEDLLNRDIVEDWREEDAATAVENRRRAAYKAKLTRSLKTGKKAKAPSKEGLDDGSSKLRGFEEFGRDGFLR